MPDFSSDLAGRIAVRHGIVTRDELVADGVGPNMIRRLVTAGALVRCHDGVYRVATSPATFESRCAAACLADPDVVITGVAAGSIWGFHHVYEPELPIVLVAHDRTPLSRGVALRRTNVLDDEDRVVRNDGITIASPPRTWFDCARDLGDDRFEMLTEFVLDRHSSIPTLWRTLRRLDRRGRPGLARVRRVLSQRAVWQKPADSGLELRVLKALRRRGLPELVRQHPIALPDGSIVHPDGAVPDAKWAVEVDHVTWHGGRISAQRDKGRDRRLRRVRWQVERVTDQELADDFTGTIDELVALYHQRVHDLAA